MSKRLVFFPEQVHPFESHWSVLNKVCRWNGVGVGVLKRLFSDSGEGGIEYARTPGNWLPLDGSRWLDRKRFCEAVHLDEKVLTDGEIDRFECASRLGGRTTTYTKGLRYCPRCMENGYHSALHQQLYLRRCPLDHGELVSLCHKCKRPIRYGIAAQDPFACPCGHVLWGRAKSKPLEKYSLEALARTVIRVDSLKSAAKRARSQAPENPNPKKSQLECISNEFVRFRDAILRETNVELPASLDGKVKTDSETAAYLAWLWLWVGMDTLEASNDVSAKLWVCFFRHVEPGTNASLPVMVRAVLAGLFTEARFVLRSKEISLSAIREHVKKCTGHFIPYYLEICEHGEIGLDSLEILKRREGHFWPELSDVTIFDEE